ncbi:alpha/beta hydrolase [Olleya sp. Bg11-27]|uniref:alpha/beta hydrolase n=1 Tax=Olleya sp. Bg11-27 TaxID=2058135 RepID=UPI000C31AB63|nr:alpha/beta hydrolase-fold protein [Olleya sp. Bg11-27]AUC77337.1 esterase [Olleya sp. Bg11-27]
MKNICLVLILCALFFGCKEQPVNLDPVPKHDNFTIVSKEVNETRVINVWTPKGYNKDNSTYPVLYMPDGGIKEDFPHIANTLSKLIDSKSIPPIILVGIENTDRRKDLSGFSKIKADEDYCPLTDGAKNFRAFITKELFSEINKRYRTTPKKGIVGESLAGLFVVETLLLEPNAFDFYIAMDPSLWWNDMYLVKNATSYLQPVSDKDIKFWFAGSNAVDISTATNKLAEVLKSNAHQYLAWEYSDEPNEAHNTIFRATKEKAFKWIMN